MWRERREGRTESGRRECCVQVCQRIWATVDTTTQARLAMGGRAELESHLPLLELAGRAPARSSFSWGKCAIVEACTAQGERRSRLEALSPHTSVHLLGPQLDRCIAARREPGEAP